MKPIKNYESLYFVDEFGQVYATGKGSSNNSQPKMLSPFPTGKDRKYLKVRLYKDGKGKDYAVHRLVAEAFVQNPHNHPHVNHLDEDTMNNHASNLEWCTPQHNKEYSSSKHFTFKSPKGEVVIVYNLSKFCRENFLSNGCMYQVLAGKYTNHKGWSLP